MSIPEKIYMIKRDMDMGTPAVQEHIRKNGGPRGFTRRKYSTGLLDEAVKLAAEQGYAVAEQMTGVGKDSIAKHARSLKRRGKTKEELRREFQGVKYSYDQLSETIERAKRLHTAQGGKTTFSSCLRRAAALNKVNYSYVKVAFNKGFVI
jgi:DNA-binding transcriptional ArsR family regulator